MNSLERFELLHSLTGATHTKSALGENPLDNEYGQPAGVTPNAERPGPPGPGSDPGTPSYLDHLSQSSPHSLMEKLRGLGSGAVDKAKEWGGNIADTAKDVGHYVGEHPGGSAAVGGTALAGLLAMAHFKRIKNRAKKIQGRV